MQVVINNLLIDFTQGKKDNATTLLFLHGWRSNKEVWQGVVRQVHKVESYKVIAMDLPGFGGSSVPNIRQPLDKLGAPQQNKKEGWGVGDYAEVVVEFIKKLELKNVILVGHSFGGRVGIKLAANYPQIISKLILVDSAGFVMDSGKKNLMNTAAKIAKPFFKPKFMQGLRKKIYEKIGSEDYVATPGIMTEIYVNTISEDLTEDMKKIACPTLLVYGDQDTATPPEFGERMKRLIPNSQLQILKDAGHFSFLDRPEEFVEVLSEFVVS